MDKRRELQIKLNTFADVKAFVTTVCKFDFNVDLIASARRFVVDAKSIMGVLSLDLSRILNVEFFATDEEMIDFSNAIAAWIV